MRIELRLQNTDPNFKHQYSVRNLVDVVEELLLLSVEEIDLQTLDPV